MVGGFLVGGVGTEGAQSLQPQIMQRDRNKACPSKDLALMRTIRFSDLPPPLWFRYSLAKSAH